MSRRFHLPLYQSALVAILVLTECPVLGQTDSLSFSLDGTSVTGRKSTSILKSGADNGFVFDLTDLEAAPKYLGSADPVRMANLLPGVQVSSEFDGGIHILGTESCHNEISISGVPIYGSNHLFGLFSVFIPTHFESMSISMDNPEAERIGGMLDMASPGAVPDSAGGDISLGIISAQGSLKLPLGSKSALFISARRSFLNTVFGERMKIDDGAMDYGFTDGNLTWLYVPGAKDRVWVDAYAGRDDCSVWQSTLNADASLDWGNRMGALHWRHDFGTIALEQSAFVTDYSCNAYFEHESMSVALPSYITTYGYRIKALCGNFKSALDIQWHDVLPQSPEFIDLPATTPQQEKQNALEIVPSLNYTGLLGGVIDYDLGFRAALYRSPAGKFSLLPEPSLKLGMRTAAGGTASVSCGLRHQNIDRKGFTDSAFPMEFHFLAGEFSEPQSSLRISTSYGISVLQDMLDLSFTAYYANLDNQVEYTGMLYDLLSSGYDIRDMLRCGCGTNYGINAMAVKRSGRLTGWAAYAFSRAMRTFTNPDGTQERFPSSYDRTHEFDIACNYKLGNWTLSGVLIAASGTPFTAPDYFYLCSGKALSHYNAHNANRLPPYVRLDVSADYVIFRKNGMEAGLNASVNNLLCRSNALYYSMKIKNNGVYYAGTSFFDIRMLPSLTLFFKF